MARIYSGKRGKAGSKKPPIKFAPRWIKYKKDEIEKLVVKLAKERHSSAVIGQIPVWHTGCQSINRKDYNKNNERKQTVSRNTRRFDGFIKKSC